MSYPIITQYPQTATIPVVWSQNAGLIMQQPKIDSSLIRILSRNTECIYLLCSKELVCLILYQKDIAAPNYFVFYFSIYVYYYNARKKNKHRKENPI